MSLEICFLFDTHGKYLYSGLAHIAPAIYFWLLWIRN